MKLHVYDDDGFLGIVNTDRYNSFVDEDWEMEQLFGHFVNEMNKQNCIVWQTDYDGGGDWVLKILECPSYDVSNREFTYPIEVTSVSLYEVNYINLTMAAQFDDTTLPIEEDWCIKLENGLYEITVRQMFDPNDYDDEMEQGFEIIAKPLSKKSEAKAEKVFWSGAINK